MAENPQNSSSEESPAPETSLSPGLPPSSSGNEVPLPRPRPRLLRWILWLIATLIILAIGGLGAGNWALERWALRPYGSAGVHKIQIKPRTKTRDIATLMRTEGVIDQELPFLVWVRLHGREERGQGASLQAGEYQIQTPITPQALLQILRRGRFERSLTIPEGWTARQIAHRLAGEGWIKNEQEWLDLVARPLGPETVGEALPGGAEGFCFPDTYRFESGTKAGEILRHMLAKFKHEWTVSNPAQRDERSASLSLQQVVTLASMIEREARTNEEMPRIASVYLNRLKRGMRMECCATVRYALGGVWDRPLLYADLKIQSPYNTYLHPGLPPGPIANPGRPAIEAVLRPAQTDFLFYVYAGNHTHIFSRTYAEHMKAVRSLRQKNPRTNPQEAPAGQVGE